MKKEDLITLIENTVPDGADVSLLQTTYMVTTEIEINHVVVGRDRGGRDKGKRFLCKKGKSRTYVLAPKGDRDCNRDMIPSVVDDNAVIDYQRDGNPPPSDILP